MKKRLLLIFTLTVFIFVINLGSIAVVGQGRQVQKYEEPIPHTIFVNRLDPKVTPSDKERRFLEIVIAPEDFNERNLQILFRTISKRYAEPIGLFANVYTSANDISEDLEADPVLPDGGTGSLSGNVAIFSRSKKDKRFLMYFGDDGVKEVKVK